MSKRSSRSSGASNKQPEKEEVNVEDVNQLSLEERPQWINNLLDWTTSFESPVDINLTYTIPVELPELIWHHNKLPSKKMKLTNTGHTLILSAKWHQERPFLSGGPLLGNYVFSQLHFHWGENNMEGSEHTIDGATQPLEMHVVHFKSCYLTQEAALKEKDGIVVLVYFFKIQATANPAVQVIVDAIPIIQKPHTSARLDALPLSFMLKPFNDDYYLYWGSVTTSSCMHLILWLISREPIGVSVDQLDAFRTLLDTNEEPLVKNFRTVQPTEDRRVFHISPGPSLYSTLLQPPKYTAVVPKNPNSKNPQPIHSEKLEPEQQVFRAELFSNNPFKSGIPRNRPHTSYEYGRERRSFAGTERPKSAYMKIPSDDQQCLNHMCENQSFNKDKYGQDIASSFEKSRTPHRHYRN